VVAIEGVVAGSAVRFATALLAASILIIVPILLDAEAAVTGTGIGILPAIVEVASFLVVVAIGTRAVASLGLVLPRVPR
jgi:hypothetical protein